ncbi:MAG: response regulator [Desulfobulbaceae bacterium]|nr:response regulator [Desulfobulbaceae bacterium]
MHVLLVDDEQEFVSTLAERLAFRGIEADWVTDGEKALEKIRSRQYDVAVLDIKMPGISGIKLGEKIHELNPKQKIIFCTGHGSSADYDAGAAQSGKEYYLAKPIKIDILIEKMKEIQN